MHVLGLSVPRMGGCSPPVGSTVLRSHFSAVHPPNNVLEIKLPGNPLWWLTGGTVDRQSYKHILTSYRFQSTDKVP